MTAQHPRCCLSSCVYALDSDCIRVCFVVWADPWERPGSPPLEPRAMHCGLETNTQEVRTSSHCKEQSVSKSGKSTYWVSPTWSGTDSALHLPSVWLQRCRRQRERAGNTQLMRSAEITEFMRIIRIKSFQGDEVKKDGSTVSMEDETETTCSPGCQQQSSHTSSGTPSLFAGLNGTDIVKSCGPSSL